MRSDDSLNQELEAMAAIGQALGRLSDANARARVLHWANERFATSTVAPATLAPVAQSTTVVAPASDPDLAVDSLGEMFVGSPASQPEASDEPRPLDVMLRSFSSDFRRFVDEWNGATA